MKILGRSTLLVLLLNACAPAWACLPCVSADIAYMVELVRYEEPIWPMGSMEGDGTGFAVAKLSINKDGTLGNFEILQLSPPSLNRNLVDRAIESSIFRISRNDESCLADPYVDVPLLLEQRFDFNLSNRLKAVPITYDVGELVESTKEN